MQGKSREDAEAEQVKAGQRQGRAKEGTAEYSGQMQGNAWQGRRR
jgi:hypothetical protein